MTDQSVMEQVSYGDSAESASDHDQTAEQYILRFKRSGEEARMLQLSDNRKNDQNPRVTSYSLAYLTL